MVGYEWRSSPRVSGLRRARAELAKRAYTCADENAAGVGWPMTHG